MTDPTDHPPAPTILLAVELRQLLFDLRNDPNECHLDAGIAERLRRLTEHVERVGTTVTGELDAIAAGLNPEQEIRARAAAIVGPPPATNANAMLVWDSAVVTLAAWIRDGSRP